MGRIESDGKGYNGIYRVSMATLGGRGEYDISATQCQKIWWNLNTVRQITLMEIIERVSRFWIPPVLANNYGSMIGLDSLESGNGGRYS